MDDFKKVFLDEIQFQISKMPSLFNKDATGLCMLSENDPKLSSISNVVFGYNNSKIIEMLMSRGNAIQNNNKNNVFKYDQQINSYIQNNKEKCKSPVMAFVTFTY